MNFKVGCLSYIASIAIVFGYFLFNYCRIALSDYVGINRARYCSANCLDLGFIRGCLVNSASGEKFV